MTEADHKHVVIFTGCDDGMFALCEDLVTSLMKGGRRIVPRIRVFDVGMHAVHVEQIASHVERIITPGWDIGENMNLPTWYRAMTARAFLPNYVDDASIIVWIDSDAWIQKLEPLMRLIEAARGGELAIVEERVGNGFSVDIPTGSSGQYRRLEIKAETVQGNIRKCYHQCYGAKAAAEFGDLPTLNGGVFALRADSPSWSIWQQYFAAGLANFRSPIDRLVDQQSVTLAVQQGRIPVALQPPEANFLCGFEMPWFSPESHALTLPGNEAKEIGIVHLHDAKYFSSLPVPNFPDGTPRHMPLNYREFQAFLKNPRNGRQISGHAVVADLGSKSGSGQVSRNALCPCGSGQRYKHCHGKLG